MSRTDFELEQGVGIVELTYADEAFRPPREPIGSVLVSERHVNERDLVVTRQTDHAQLTPLPAPGARASQMTYVFTERPTETFDPTLTGQKTAVDNLIYLAPLQDQNPYESYHVNTLRIEPTPWDEELIG